jgi:GGDEF domain-containing protein
VTAHAIVYSRGDGSLPSAVESWLVERSFTVHRLGDSAELFDRCNRSQPRIVVFDGRWSSSIVVDAIRRLKADAYTSVIPSVVVTGADVTEVGMALDAGADDVVPESAAGAEATARLAAALRRSDRDVQVHPSTRLPGAVEIDAEIARRMTAGASFAACYADIDFFKEFNDRYSYLEGDRVIRIAALIFHDVVRGVCGRTGFVGHIGGDDFIFIIPVEDVGAVCGEIIDVFDTLLPFQYSEDDRTAGYFLGRDRRDQLHRVPLMTISIGVVTTERRRFSHAAQVSALATEMKSYAKTLPGSVFSIDRRHDDSTTNTLRESGPIRLMKPSDGGPSQ